MIPTKSTSKVKFIIYSAYLIMAALIFFALAVTIIAVKKSKIIKAQLVQTHSVRLDVNNFQKTLEKIKSQME